MYKYATYRTARAGFGFAENLQESCNLQINERF